MTLVATRDTDLEEASGFPSELVILLVVVGVSSFLAGWCCSKLSTRVPTSRPLLPSSNWERLARKALRFISRRRRASLALTSYSDSTLRNSEGSKPNKARQALRARATTPGRLLHEGPAVVSRHGSNQPGVGSNSSPSRCS